MILSLLIKVFILSLGELRTWFHKGKDRKMKIKNIKDLPKVEIA